jgi:hypothetical protein
MHVIIKTHIINHSYMIAVAVITTKTLTKYLPRSESRCLQRGTYIFWYVWSPIIEISRFSDPLHVRGYIFCYGWDDKTIPYKKYRNRRTCVQRKIPITPLKKKKKIPITGIFDHKVIYTCHMPTLGETSVDQRTRTTQQPTLVVSCT